MRSAVSELTQAVNHMGEVMLLLAALKEGESQVLWMG